MKYFDKLSEQANSAKNFSEASQSDYDHRINQPSRTLNTKAKAFTPNSKKPVVSDSSASLESQMGSINSPNSHKEPPKSPIRSQSQTPQCNDPLHFNSSSREESKFESS